jgi:hypothetical protein
MDVSLAVRVAHLLAMGVLLGGGALCAWALLRRDPDAGTTLRRYEWAFWAAVGVSVATGVGNLGAFGDGLPPSASGWGAALRWKLGIALAGLPLSALRTVLAHRPTGRTRPILLALHAATLAGLVATVTLAEVMAHGG